MVHVKTSPLQYMTDKMAINIDIFYNPIISNGPSAAVIGYAVRRNSQYVRVCDDREIINLIIVQVIMVLITPGWYIM